MAVALSACGGGGGSPGTVPGQPAPGPNPTAVPASVTLATSASTILASGAAGTEVTLTVIVKDAGNNALSGVAVSFNASSGTVSNTNRTTDANGTVTEKLSVLGDSSPRDITITASAGTIVSAAKVVTVTAASSAAPKVLLTASSGTLASAGAAGTGVSIRALVIDTNNVVVPGAIVTFTTDSGSLTVPSPSVTNASGVATATLDTGADPTTRTITVTAAVPGASSTVKVNVTGTRITLNAVATVNAGSVSDISAVLTDSLGNPLANRPMTFSTSANQVTVKGGGSSPANTDSAGKLVLSFSAVSAGSADVTLTSLGETATVTIKTVAEDFTIVPVTTSTTVPAQVSTSTCVALNVKDFVGGVAQVGNVTISSSRGTIYSDAACSSALSVPITLSAGTATVYVMANSPGVATLSATSSVTGSTIQNGLEFVAPLTASSVITLQATPAVIGANSTGSITQQSVLRAAVNDSQGNPVKNAKVAFSILTDPSGGTLSQPSEVLTGSDGSATVSYIAGSTATAVDGVIVQATIQSPITTASTTTKLTVAQRSLFISAGTGNTVLIPSSTTYQVDYAVFVTDAAGNAVPNVTITGAVRPRFYYKGTMFYALPSGPWTPSYTAGCLNEDANSDGVLGIGEDTNGNGRLDPVIPMNITSSGKTDATGTATVSMTYPKDRAYWLDVDFTIRGAVSGSEARYVGYTMLPGAASDYKDPAVAPPGKVSPYGKSSICTDVN